MQLLRLHRRRKAPAAKVACALLLLSTTQWKCGAYATIDVPAQLHQLQLRSSASGSDGDAAAPQVVLTNVPDSLFQRLSEKSVRWDVLSGYLQRALLWEIGLVMTSGGRLVQVYVPCDEDMSVVLTTFEAFQDKDCPLETCDSTQLYFAGSTCSRSTVWKAAQCGIHASEKNATDIVDAESSTLWAEDGSISSVPDVQLYKHVKDDSSGSNGIEEVVGSGSSGNYTIEADVLFTINQIEPLPCTTESCPPDPFFVAPCVQFRDPNEMAENPWCLPKRGGFVDLWLASEISGESMTSGSSPTSTSALSTGASTSISGDTVILVVLFICLAAAVGALAAVHIHRKKRDAEKPLESSPTVFASATTTRSKRRGYYGNDTLNGQGSPRSSMNESRRRRSMELTTFCDDANITSKRIPRLRAKLSDFGLSRERSSDDTMTNGVGTLLWTAPEILRGEAYSEKADVYSYAIVLSELDTCLPPFTLNTEVSERHLTTMQLMHLATSGQVSPTLRDDCPAALQQLTAACASYDPSQRPHALEIVFTLRNIARSMKYDPAKRA
ncbi:hypothetical protein PHYPSEUDO_012044 [Phytophthora pseudosyringae]|uniref:Protein kinase domain-containing protein n=1 Tax=Phytophthora pseudosyringae TaxID=221518 RepID=A0A8T1V7E6_9STRA|nr:hypothetical protein PHYPSEUDO_012044 [Phytophthora pseudosyringae]